MSKIKLSIIDDHTILREGLCCLFQSDKRIEVVSTFSSGIQFINSLNEIIPDIAIIDICMPEMDGIKTIKKAREIVPALKIIVLTMHSENHYYTQLLRLKINGYVLKTSNYEELRHAIKVVAKDGQFYSQQLLINQLQSHKDKSSIILTDLEKRILLLISQGLSTLVIARQLGLSVGAVEKHRSKLLLQTGVSNSISLIVYAVKNDLIKLE